MTKPKKRPDGIAVSPPSLARASRSITSTGSVGPSGSSAPSRAATSSELAAGGTARPSRDSSQAHGVLVGAVQRGCARLHVATLTRRPGLR